MGIWTKLLVSAVGSLVAAAAIAQSWPSRPIHVIVGANAGTSPDIIARITGAEMTKHLGQPIVVENRGGAGGDVARMAVSQADPDGYLLLVSGLPIAGHPIFVKTGGFVLGKDMAGIASVVKTSVVVLARTSMAKTWQELVAYGKANPKKLNFGSQTASLDVAMEFAATQAGFTYTPIRYKGAPVAEMLRGELDFYVGTLSNLAPHIQAGKIAPLLGFAPVSAYPDLPTAQGLGLFKAHMPTVIGYYGPLKLPNDVTQKIAQAVEAATKTAAVRDGLTKIGLDVSFQGPEQVMKEYEAQVAVYMEATRATNFQPQ